MTRCVRVRLHLTQIIPVLDNVRDSRLWRFHVDVGRSRCSLLSLTMSVSDSVTVCGTMFMSASVSIFRVRHPWWYTSNTVYMFAIVSDSVHNRFRTGSACPCSWRTTSVSVFVSMTCVYVRVRFPVHPSMFVFVTGSLSASNSLRISERFSCPCLTTQIQKRTHREKCPTNTRTQTRTSSTRTRIIILFGASSFQSYFEFK